MPDSLFSRCRSVLVFDTETTGLSPAHDEIIEFAAVKLELRDGVGVITAEEDEFICRRDNRRLPPRITALTGITDEMLCEDGISKQAFAALLAELLDEDTMLAAYNAQFDLLFLYYFLSGYGDARILKGKPKLDVLTIYRDRRPYPYRLNDAIHAFGLQDCVRNSHRAIDDVRATVELLRAMEAERADLDRYIDLFGYFPKYGVSGPRIGSVRYVPQTEGQPPLYEVP